jgi:hypothetical protein
MKTWTVGEMLDERPCGDYTRERLLRLWRGRERLGLADILRLRIPAVDRLWATNRPDALTAEQRSRATESTVTRAVRRHALPCPATRDWARRWLSGADRSEDAAEAASWGAWSTLRDATGDARTAALAAEAAAWAARDAAWAARTAAWTSIEDVSWDAAWAAKVAGGAVAEAREYARQVRDVLAVLDEGD